MLDKYTKWAGTGHTYTGRTISATREVQVSKKMTTLLRHRLDDRHWSPNAEGYVFFGDLTRMRNSRGFERVAVRTK